MIVCIVNYSKKCTMNLNKTFKLLKKYPNPIRNKQCSEFEVNNWLVSEFVMKELVPIVGIHPYPLNELMLMTATLCVLRPTHIFEWGTNLGKSARIFYEITKHFSILCEIHSIDLPDNVKHKEHPRQNRGIFVKDISQVRLYQGDGLNTSLALCKDIHKKSQPLFFLDGDHEYRSVKRELDNILKNVSNVSILVHDTFFQSSRSKYNIGPYKAVCTTLRLVPDKYKIISTNMGLPGMTLLYENRNK